MRKYAQGLKSASLKRKHNRELRKARGEAIRGAARAEGLLASYGRAQRRADTAEEALRAAGTLEGKRMKDRMVEELARALADQVLPQVEVEAQPYIRRVSLEVARNYVALHEIPAYVDYTLDTRGRDAVLKGRLNLNMDTALLKRSMDSPTELGTPVGPAWFK